MCATQATTECVDIKWFGYDFSGRLAVQIGFALLLAALALYLMTMYAYDRLLMPIRFWGEGSRRRRRAWLPARPPSSAAWVLYRNMMRIWYMIFTPATVLVGMAFTLLAITLLRLETEGLVVLVIGCQRTSYITGGPVRCWGLQTDSATRVCVWRSTSGWALAS
jgi:hypothetical protein